MKQLSKTSTIIALLRQHIIENSESIAKEILNSDEELINILINRWIKRQSPEKINISDVVSQLVKEYSQDAKFKELSAEIQLSYDEYDYDMKLLDKPKTELEFKFYLALISEKIDRWGRPETVRIYSGDHVQNLDIAIAGLKANYEKVKYPAQSPEIVA
jgi:hypothetical protein